MNLNGNSTRQSNLSIKMKGTFSRLWSFTSYVDTFLTFFGHLPPFVDSFYVIKVDIFELHTCPPLLINVVCERPLIKF